MYYQQFDRSMGLWIINELLNNTIREFIERLQKAKISREYANLFVKRKGVIILITCCRNEFEDARMHYMESHWELLWEFWDCITNS